MAAPALDADRLARLLDLAGGEAHGVAGTGTADDEWSRLTGSDVD